MSVERTDLVKMGQHLATLRKSKKMTQMKLAEILDVSNKTVSKWETGDIAPDITLLRPLADVLDVSVNELLAGYNTEDSDDVVSYYKKFSKKKLIKETSIFAIIIFAMVMLIAAVERYYMWNVETIYSGEDNLVQGYIFKNNKEYKIIIDNIDLSNKYADIKIKSLNISLLNGDRILLKKEINNDNDNDNDVYLVDILDSMLLFYESTLNDDIKLDNVVLNIEYSIDGKNKNYISIFLK